MRMDGRWPVVLLAIGLAAVREVVATGSSERGGMISRSYRVVYPDRTPRIWSFEMPDGRIAQYQIVQ